MTLQSLDPVKVVSVRGTAFEPAAAQGGSAAKADAPSGDFASKVSEFVKSEIHKSGRPELASARIVISGGMSSFFFAKIVSLIARNKNHCYCC